MNRHKTLFSDSLRLWILLNRILGFWPYHRSAASFVQSKYHFFFSMRCFSLFALMFYFFNTFLDRKLERTNLFGHLFTFIGGGLIFLWILLSVWNNNRLVQLFQSIDKFDDVLKKNLSRSIPLTKFYRFPVIKFLFAAFSFDFVCFIVLMHIDTKKVVSACIISILRFGFRLSHFFFVILYCHTIQSLKLRFLTLKSVWQEIVVTNTHRPFLHSHISVKMDEIKLSYHYLLVTVNNTNICFGSRIALLYTMMFYYACMYFYMICIGHRFTAIVFLSYPLIIIVQITSITQNMISAVSNIGIQNKFGK